MLARQLSDRGESFSVGGHRGNPILLSELTPRPCGSIEPSAHVGCFESVRAALSACENVRRFVGP
jgi:hypothetical protein